MIINATAKAANANWTPLRIDVRLLSELPTDAIGWGSVGAGTLLWLPREEWETIEAAEQTLREEDRLRRAKHLRIDNWCAGEVYISYVDASGRQRHLNGPHGAPHPLGIAVFANYS